MVERYPGFSIGSHVSVQNPTLPGLQVSKEARLNSRLTGSYLCEMKSRFRFKSTKYLLKIVRDKESRIELKSTRSEDDPIVITINTVADLRPILEDEHQFLITTEFTETYTLFSHERDRILTDISIELLENNVNTLSITKLPN